MTKNFKIARKPGAGVIAGNQDGATSDTRTNATMASNDTSKTVKGASVKRTKSDAAPSPPLDSPTTRKTIEVPEDFFYQVKMRALERKIKEKELWAEIVGEYFRNHPAA